MSSESTGKHIVLIGPVYPYRGGIAHFLEAIYHGMSERNHELSAVTFTRQYPELLFPGKTQYADAATSGSLNATRLIDTLNPWTWIKAARHIARLNPDAVLFKYWMSFFAPAFGTIARYLRRKGIKVLCVVDNVLPHERRPGDVVLGRYFLRACDGLVVMSDSVADDLDALHVTAPVEHVRHPVYDIFGEQIPREEARRRLDLPSSAPIVLFFGFIRQYKGLHVLLEAMPRIVRRYPEMRLVVAGEFYDDESTYRELIRTHHLEDNVDLHANYIPEDEVNTYFCAADLVVQPYVSATQSGVAQIAYHFERPLIVTDVGGLPEVVPHEKAGFIVPPEDPRALADAVDRFFAEEWADRLEDGVREEKKKYSWKRLFEALERLMDRSAPD